MNGVVDQPAHGLTTIAEEMELLRIYTAQRHTLSVCSQEGPKSTNDLVHQPQALGLMTILEENNSLRNLTHCPYVLSWKQQWPDNDTTGSRSSVRILQSKLVVDMQAIIEPSIPSRTHGFKEGTRGKVPDFLSLIRACTRNRDLQRGIRLHDDILKRGLLGSHAGALVTMYAKCDALLKAKSLLDRYDIKDVIAWTALIAGYVRAGQCEDAFYLFEHMQQKGISPNAVTYACILKACGTLGALEMGKQIHDEIMKQGLLQNDVVLGGALVDMYAKCNTLAKAREVLDILPLRDVISWSALIAGYVQWGQAEEAMSCFESMQKENISPNAVTYACILKACGMLGAIDKGKQIHEEIESQDLLQDDIVLGGVLVDMYAKCGDLTKAHCVLDELPSRNAVAWCALIAGYAQQGQGEEALKRFEQMQQEGIPPNGVTLCCVLHVCSQLGRIEEGHNYFTDMGVKYGLKPPIEVYASMVDLFGRAGHLEKAVRLIREMPCCNHSVIWRALLAACRKWGDISVGRWAFDRAIEVDKKDGAAYILMANIYAAAGLQESAKGIETMRVENNAW
ncbi:hypothetical protein KP509_34G056100 [Ceratopteris richardii]|nr:hypothetical protein KP509_34G056100 [Ceratopteris richardii]